MVNSTWSTCSNAFHYQTNSQRAPGAPADAAAPRASGRGSEKIGGGSSVADRGSRSEGRRSERAEGHLLHRDGPRCFWVGVSGCEAAASREDLLSIGLQGARKACGSRCSPRPAEKLKLTCGLTCEESVAHQQQSPSEGTATEQLLLPSSLGTSVAMLSLAARHLCVMTHASGIHARPSKS